MSISDDEFSSDELAFLSSRGSDDTALERAYKPAGGGERSGGTDEGDRTPAPAKGDDEGAPKAKEPAAEDDDDEDGEADGKRSEFVPHGRFHKERTRRQAAEEALNAEKVRMARAEERLAIMNELIATRGDPGESDDEGAPAAKPGGKVEGALKEADINPLEDFAGAIDQMRRRQAEFMQQVQARDQQQDARSSDQQLTQGYVRDVQAYVQKEPAFKGAYTHLMKAFHRELEAYGMTDVAQRNAHINKQEKELVSWAIQNQKSPAAVLYALAESRGFTKPEQSAEDGGEAEEPAGSEVKAKIAAINKGKSATPSLSGGGGAPVKSLTMASILDMDDDAFFERVHKLSPEKRRKVLGG